MKKKKDEGPEVGTAQSPIVTDLRQGAEEAAPPPTQVHFAERQTEFNTAVEQMLVEHILKLMRGELQMDQVRPTIRDFLDSIGPVGNKHRQQARDHFYFTLGRFRGLLNAYNQQI